MVFVIALVPAVVVYLLAAASGKFSTLFWASFVAIVLGMMGPPTFLFLDVGAVVLAFVAACLTLDLKKEQKSRGTESAAPDTSPSELAMSRRRSSEALEPLEVRDIRGARSARALRGVQDVTDVRDVTDMKEVPAYARKASWGPPPGSQTAQPTPTHFTARGVRVPITSNTGTEFRVGNQALKERFSAKYPEHDFEHVFHEDLAKSYPGLAWEDAVYIELRRQMAIAEQNRRGKK